MGVILIGDAILPSTRSNIESGASLQVSIWWAVLFVVMLILVVFYLFYRIMLTHERKKVEELKAQWAREKEKDMDMMKQRVLSNVSQELLTPVTLIISPLQQLVSESLADDVKSRIQMILRNSQILLHQINMLPSGTKSNIIPAILSTPDPVIPSSTPQVAVSSSTGVMVMSLGNTSTFSRNWR